MSRSPAHRVKIGRVEPSDVHERVERQEDAPLGEFPDPRKVRRDNVVSADLALRVAKRLLAKLVDRKRAQLDPGADHLLELPLQIVHHHERWIGVSQNPQSARQAQSTGKDARRIDVRARAIAPQEIMLVGNPRFVTEMPAREKAHAGRHGRHRVHKLLARVNRKTAAGTAPRSALEQSRGIHLLEAAASPLHRGRRRQRLTRSASRGGRPGEHGRDRSPWRGRGLAPRVRSRKRARRTEPRGSLTRRECPHRHARRTPAAAPHRRRVAPECPMADDVPRALSLFLPWPKPLRDRRSVVRTPARTKTTPAPVGRGDGKIASLNNVGTSTGLEAAFLLTMSISTLAGRRESVVSEHKRALEAPHVREDL